MILLDVMMPGVDGWRVAEMLLDDPAPSDIPIVFLTARADLRDRARGIDLGGLEYITNRSTRSSWRRSCAACWPPSSAASASGCAATSSPSCGAVRRRFGELEP